ncbi:MAG: DUF92 domain-containing protein [Anaerolineaceae bacterium]|nr:DUF92 domain-containing protein [Anaerolineaceae bacterium]
MVVKLLIGLIAGVGIAALAYRARSLSLSGAIAAGALGTIVFGLGGVAWALVLLTFFVTASGLSVVFKGRKSRIADDFAKGSRRDAGQVAANGGISGVLALSYFLLNLVTPQHPLLPALWLGFAASLAAANADTWATELGVLNPHQPISLRTCKRVPSGTSGAISWVGTLAALAGSAVVAGVAVLTGLAGWAPAGGLSLGGQFVLISLAGLLGAMVDSTLGAWIQAMYYCPTCQKDTERHPLHSCGTETTLARGIKWLQNDWVNAACTLSAAAAAVVIKLIIL